MGCLPQLTHSVCTQQTAGTCRKTRNCCNHRPPPAPSPCPPLAPKFRKRKPTGLETCSLRSSPTTLSYQGLGKHPWCGSARAPQDDRKPQNLKTCPGHCQHHWCSPRPMPSNPSWHPLEVCWDPRLPKPV